MTLSQGQRAGLSAALQPLIRRPLVCIAAALIAGVVLADVRPLPPAVTLLAAGACALLCVTATRAALAAGAALLATFLLGAGLHTLSLTPAADDASTLVGHDRAEIVGHLVRLYHWSPHYASGVLQADSARALDGSGLRVSGRVLVRVDGDASAFVEGAALGIPVESLSLPPAPRNWFQPDRRKLLARDGIHAVDTTQSVRLIGRLAAHQGLAAQLLDLRSSLLQVLERAVRGQNRTQDAALLASMVFGESAVPLDEDLKELFRKTGTIHLLVVSGAQVAIILAFIFTLHRPRELPAAMLGTHARIRPAWWHWGVAAPALVLFGLMVGMGPSVARSLIMAGIWLVAMASGRRYDLASSVALAAIILVLTSTSVVFNIGAQLTFAATVGVSLCLPGKPASTVGVSRLRLFLRQAVRSAGYGTLGAWLFVTPLLAHYFTNVALTGSLANLIAVPLSGAIVLLGLAAMILGSVWGPLAVPLCAAAKALLWVVVSVNKVCVLLPLANLDHVYLSEWGCLAWIAGAATGVQLARTGRFGQWWREAPGALLVWLAVALAIVTCVFAARELWPRPWRIMTFDVGEGQCTLIESPRRRTLMVDCGSRRETSNYELARDVVYPYLVRRGYRAVDLLVLSHPDIDHYGAASYLARRMPILTVQTTGRPGSPTYLQTLQALRKSGATVREGLSASPAHQRLGDLPYSLASVGAGAWGDNNASLIVRLESGALTALLPGDLEVPGQVALLRSSPLGTLRSDFLQLPHHGRDSACFPPFLEAVAPAVAVVTRAGEPEVRGGAAACRQVCRHVYDTEETGAVRVEADGDGLVVRTKLGE